jgi:hypothetical protein
MRDIMIGPKDRHKQLIQERKTKLKMRDSEDKSASKKEAASSAEEEPQEAQSDDHQQNTTPGDRAEKVREYRKRQKEKLKGTEQPLNSKKGSRNHKIAKEEDDGG